MPEPCGPCSSGAARGEQAFEPEETDDGLDVRDAAVGTHVERLLQIDTDNLEMLALVKGLRAVGEILGQKHDDALIGITDRIVEFTKSGPARCMNAALLDELALRAVEFSLALIELARGDLPESPAQRMAPLPFEDDRAVSPQGDHTGRATVAQAESAARTSIGKNDVLFDHLYEATVKKHAFGDGRFGERIFLALGAGNGSLKLRIGAFGGHVFSHGGCSGKKRFLQYIPAVRTEEAHAGGLGYNDRFLFSKEHQYMHAAVVGAGLTGLQTALSLVRKGADVTVIEAQRAPCQGASYCAGAVLGDPAPAPIARPAGRLARLKALASNSSELVYCSGTAVRHAGFISAMTACREPARCEARNALAAELSEVSTSMLRAEAQEHGFILQESAGTIIVSPKADDASPATLEDVTAIEPSLYAATDVGSFSFSRATTWSVSYYAKQLREHLSEAGVKILCSRKATGLISGNGRICGVAADEPVRADAVIVACGTGALEILPEHAYGSVPLAPITRSVLNVSLSGDACVMRHAVRTPEGRIALPLDTFVRIMGRWHLGAQEHCPIDEEYKALWEMGVKLFPTATDWSQGRYLSHTVLSSPDGLPVAGASDMPGLHLSIAGGIHGADFCTAVADVVSDGVLGRENPFSERLSWRRFGRQGGL